MTKIYLDANDMVCVDTTRDERDAKLAGLERDVLKYNARLEHLGDLVDEIRVETGRPPKMHAAKVEVQAFNAKIRADASKRRACS